MLRDSEEDLEKALTHFRNYLRTRGFEVTTSAASSLREYAMRGERKRGIITQLREGEKTFDDLIEGFSKLATLSSEIALSEGRRSVTSQDVDGALGRIFCKVWPFCKKR
jgi:hypothetical protein